MAKKETSNVERAYMEASIDYLSNMERYLESISGNIDVLTEVLLEKEASLERLVSESSLKGGGSAAGDKFLATIDKLTTKIEDLSKSIDQKEVIGGGGSKPSHAKGMSVDSKSIGELGKDVKSFADGLFFSLPKFLAIKPFTDFMGGTIVQFIKSITHDLDKRKLPKAEAVGKILASMKNVGEFAKALAKSAKYYPLARVAAPLAAKLVATFVNAFDKKLMKDADVNKAEKVAGTIEVLSKSILDFSKNLALSTPFLLAAMPGLLILKTTAKWVGQLAETLGKHEKDISSTTKSLNKISLSLVAFAGSLALSAMIVSSLTMDDGGSLLVLLGAMALTSYVFAKIGDSKMDTNITKGAVAIGVMSLSILAFGLAMRVATETLPDYSDLLKLTISLAAFGALYYFAGEFAFGSILKGSLAFLTIGVSLWVVGKAIQEFGSVIDENPNIIWQAPLMLFGLGTVFALAGAGPVPLMIALGAAALGIAGGALWVIGKGLRSIADAAVDKETAENIGWTIRGVVTGFAKAFDDISLKEALLLPMKIPVVGAMGLSLAALGYGIGKYQASASDFGPNDADQISYTIGSLSKAFALAGSTDGQMKIFGFPIGENDTERGIESTLKMGKNLGTLADGIGKWKKLKLDEEAVQEIANNVGRVLNVIPGIFAEIGMRERGSQNQMDLFGVKIGVPFTSTDTELGIEATMKMGNNLKNLADGIISWKTMKITQEDMQLITNNISQVLNTIPAVFAAIGKREKGSTDSFTFFGHEFLNPFSEGDVEAGIESVEDLGLTLKNLADGVMAWKDGGTAGFKASDLPGIKNNILSVIGAIPQAFAEIGRQDKDSEGMFFWSDGDIERGVELVDGLLPSIKGIGDFVKQMSFIKDEKFGQLMGKTIRDIFGAINGSLMVIKDKELDKLDRLVLALSKIPKVFKEANKHLKDHTDYIMKLEPKYLDNFKVWSESLERMSNVDPLRLEKNPLLSRQLANIDQPKMDWTFPADVTSQKNSSTPVVPVMPATAPKTTIRKNAPTVSQSDQIMAQLMQMINQLTASQASQQATLNQIATLLASGIKIKDNY